MSSTLLRLGLWIVLISLGLYVIHETYPNTPLSDYLSASMLQKFVFAGVAAVIIGFVLRFFEKAAAKAMRQRCTVCRKPIPHGEIYCREHLRQILDQEDARRHAPLRR